MEDPAAFTAAAFTQQLKTQFSEHEQLRCPRCDSTNTKFCYYNNYNLSQPRHFCKSCRRYWTKGGALRNIPVGGGTRKTTKRSAPTKQQQPRVIQNPSASTTSSSGSGSVLNQHQVQKPSLKSEPTAPIVGAVGAEAGSGVPAGDGVSFTSLLGLASGGHFGNFLEGLSQSGQKAGPGQSSGLNGPSDGFMVNGLQNGSEANCWGGSGNNGWPDLAI